MPDRRPNPSPSFERVMTTIHHEEPGDVPLAEVWVDPVVKWAFLGGPLRSLRHEVNLWAEAGYDSLAVDTHIHAAPQIQRHVVRPVDDTARLCEDAPGSGAGSGRPLRRFAIPRTSRASTGLGLKTLISRFATCYRAWFHRT